MIAEAFQDRPRRRNPLLLPVRFLLYWAVKTLVLLFLGIRFLLRPRLVRFGLLILLVGGAIAWKVAGSPSLVPSSAAPASAARSNVVSTTPAIALVRPAAVEAYFKAQAAYDAKGMYDTMTDDLKRRMVTSGNTQDQLQKDLDSSRQEGRTFSQVDYVGGEALTGGKGAYFYVLTVQGPNGPSKLPYAFVLDPDGKISNIQWSM